MGKIIRHTDLAGEEPGARAHVDLPQEDFEFEEDSEFEAPSGLSVHVDKGRLIGRSGLAALGSGAGSEDLDSL
jgi:hypothetical protein